MAYIIARKITIAGIDVTSYLKLATITQNSGEAISTLEITVPKTIETVLTLTNGQTVIFWRNMNGSNVNDVTDPTHRIFKGYVETYYAEGGSISIVCKNQLGLALRKTHTRMFLDTDAEGGKISEIFKTLLTVAGLNYSSSTIQDSGTIIKLSKFRCTNSYIFERLQKLAEMLNWQFYYRADTDMVYFEPEGYTSNTNIIGDGNILKKIKWENDTKDMVNDLTIIGAKQLVTRNPDQTFSGNGTQKVFILPATPEDIKVTVGGSPKKCGIKGAGAGLDVYVDKQTKSIEFVVAPPVGTNNIVVAFTYNAPVPVRLTRQTSITTYGKYQKEMTLMDVVSIDDAISRANRILDKYSVPFKYATIKINDHNLYNIRAGDRIRIDDNVNGVDGYFIVQRYIQNYPTNYDEIQVGEKEKDLTRFVAALSDKTKRLEEEEYRDTEILVNLVQDSVPFSLVPKRMKITNSAINDSFIIGHPVNAIIGTARLGSRKTVVSELIYDY